MRVVILAGGMGTRISEETQLKPKPMIEIGGRPILWHIMKIYSAYGLNEFVVCVGYKGYVIKEFFANYFLHVSDVTFDIGNNRTEIHRHNAEPWRVTLVDTGEETMTGGRLKRAQRYIGNEPFCMTYGDGVGDIDIRRLIEFHQQQGCLATLSATQPPARFGALRVDGSRVAAFKEKVQGEDGWINGGFFVLSPRVFDYLADDATVWEREPLERLAHEGQLAVYLHRGFWHPMDTLRDKTYLESLWASGRAPWRVWE